MSYDNPKWLDRHTWQYSEVELWDLLAEAGLRVRQWGRSQSPGGGHFNVELERLDMAAGGE